MVDAPLSYGFVAYIDEAGDTGLNRVRPIDPVGGTEWLCVSAVLVRVENEPNVSNWVRDIRSDIDVKQRPDLHFRKLSPTRKLAVAQCVAALPIRCFVVASNKKNMRGYRNPRAEKAGADQWFYNWLVRVVIERITDYCERRCLRNGGEIQKVKFVFSKRGGHRYSQTQAYHWVIKAQARNDHMVLTKRMPKWRTMDERLVSALQHEDVAGLQLADVIASAFYTAVDNLETGPCDPTYAKALGPRMALENGSARDYGVCLQPTPASKGKLSRDQQEIFRFYGYRDLEFKERLAAPGSRRQQ